MNDVVAGLQKALQQEQTPAETAETVPEPIEHVEIAAQNAHQQLATQLQQMQEIMQAM